MKHLNLAKKPALETRVLSAAAVILADVLHSAAALKRLHNAPVGEVNPTFVDCLTRIPFIILYNHPWLRNFMNRGRHFIKNDYMSFLFKYQPRFSTQ